MEQTTPTTENNPFEEMIAAMPEEVQDFVLGEGYQRVVDVISEVLNLSAEQKKDFDNAIWEILAKKETMDSIAVRWQKAGWENETIVKALYAIDSEIIKRVENIVEFYADLEAPAEDSPEETLSSPNAPSPTEALANIQARLQTAATVAPVKRDYSLDSKPVEQPAPTPSKTIDPYRELPQ